MPRSRSIRTTVTLDEDIAARLSLEARKTNQSLRKVLNDVLRRGFAYEQRSRPLEPFRVEAYPLGLPTGLSYDNVEELLEQLEGPVRR